MPGTHVTFMDLGALRALVYTPICVALPPARCRSTGRQGALVQMQP